MNVYIFRNESPDSVSITNGYLGGEKPENLLPGDVWVKTGGYSRLIKAAQKAASVRFNVAMSDMKTTCIQEPT